jgi:hypothetical protein
MGFLNIFKPRSDAPPALPSGSFTVDRDGKIIASTITSRFPKEKLKEISAAILGAFAEARNAGVPASELTLRFGLLSLRAVDMRGGAMIFLSAR